MIPAILRSPAALRFGSMILGLWAFAACTVNVDFAGTEYRCAGGECPGGFRCEQGICRRLPADGGDAHDAAPGVDAFGDAPQHGSLCGDGRITGAEACDDGNREDADACLSTCEFARCGDGVLRPGVEGCDDGNTTNGDGCAASCLACPGGVVSATTGHCYTRHLDKRIYGPASDACATTGAHLATLTSQAENDEVVLAFTPGDPLWIGLAKTDLATGDYVWTTGEPLLFTNWTPGHPDDEACVALVPGGLWSARSCSQELDYLCEDEGWTLRPEDHHAYRVLPVAVGVEAGIAACAALSAHLATITTPEEQAFLVPLAGTPLWIGARREAGAMDFTWPTGEPFVTTSWAVGQPDLELEAQACVILTGVGWDDVRCGSDAPHGTLCEAD